MYPTIKPTMHVFSEKPFIVKNLFWKLIYVSFLDYGLILEVIFSYYKITYIMDSRMNNIIANLKLANSYAKNTQLFLAFNAFRYPEGLNPYTLHYAALYTDGLYYNLADVKLDIIRNNFKYRFEQEIVTLNIITNNKSKYSNFTDYCNNNIKEFQVNIFDIKSFFSEENLLNLSNKLNKHSAKIIVFVFEDVAFCYVRSLFYIFNINLSSGNNTLKGFISPKMFFLTNIICSLYGDQAINIVYKSFNSLSKNKFLTRSLRDDINLSFFYDVVDLKGKNEFLKKLISLH